MFFFALLLFLLTLWFFPWWCLGMAAFLLGFKMFAGPRRVLQVMAAGGLACASLAFLQDGRNYGLIAERLSGLFHLPSPHLMYVLMAALGMVSTLLAFQAGATIGRFFYKATEGSVS